MQIYAAGVDHLFWQQVANLPAGLHNRESNQAPAVPTEQLFTSFVDRPAGTTLGLYMNSIKLQDVIVVDDTGFVYARIVLPHTHNESTIELQLRDGTVPVESSSFATSNIAFLFAVRADVLTKNMEDAVQLEEDNSIAGVEDSLLEDKYGVFTGLSRRNNQSLTEYRGQTQCLWTSFRFAGTVKGLVDSLKCLLGDITIVLEPTRDVIGNLIFDKDQYVPKSNGAGGDVFTPNPGFWDNAGNRKVKRFDTDTPHYYVADLSPDFRTSYAPGGDPTSIILNGGPDNTPDGWSPDHVRSMTIRTLEAIGNEIFVNIEESDAIRNVVGEQVVRRGDTNDDILSNGDIAGPIIVTDATTPSTLMPVDGVDFTVDLESGTITWLGTPQQPTTATLYSVNYPFRLDDEIVIVVKQIKPVQRSVVILFLNQTSGLPKAIEA